MRAAKGDDRQEHWRNRPSIRRNQWQTTSTAMAVSPSSAQPAPGVGMQASGSDCSTRPRRRRAAGSGCCGTRPVLSAETVLIRHETVPAEGARHRVGCPQFESFALWEEACSWLRESITAYIRKSEPPTSCSENFGGDAAPDRGVADRVGSLGRGGTPCAWASVSRSRPARGSPSRGGHAVEGLADHRLLLLGHPLWSLLFE